MKKLSITGEEYNGREEITRLVNKLIPELFNKHNVKILETYANTGNQNVLTVYVAIKGGIWRDVLFEEDISQETAIEKLCSIYYKNMFSIGVVKEKTLEREKVEV